MKFEEQDHGNSVEIIVTYEEMEKRLKATKAEMSKSVKDVLKVTHLLSDKLT